MTKVSLSKSVSSALRQWYLANQRALPWRLLYDPYSIWLSEVIMQQTRVEQGTPYWIRFINRYSDVHALASASQDDVLKVWEGLGYYSRARNLHKAAKMVSNEMDGVFPDTAKGLLALPGVGPYIAAAVASICYGESVPVVDGNVYRLLSRLYLIDTPINTTKAFKEFSTHAAALLVGHEPRIINQAMMEFGATVCTYRSPSCGECVLQSSCGAYATNRIAQLPVKKAKKTVREREMNFHLIMHHGDTFVVQREAGDIWQGLYEFLMIETPVSEEPLIVGRSDRLIAIEDSVHILSHQRIKARFFIIESDDVSHIEEMGAQVKKIPIDKLDDYAFARITTRVLEKRADLLVRN